MNDCVFCKIIKGEIPSQKIYEDEAVFAFKDHAPKAPIHVLIVPKIHLQDLNAALTRPEIMNQALVAGVKIAKELGISEAYKVGVNTGELAGQTVMHLHFHLLGGWKEKSEVVSELHQ